MESEQIESIPPFAKSLSLRSFRNYRTLDRDLTPELTILTGDNAQGKTNFLEALYLLATGALLRGRKDHEAIFEGSDLARVSATLGPYDHTIAMEIPNVGRKRAFFNGASVPRPSDLLGRLPCCCVTMEDLALLRGDPSDRRRFLDLELSALYPRYFQSFATYKRALEHRNKLLKSAQEGFSDDVAFETFEEAMASSGSVVMEFRAEYILRLAVHAAAHQTRMSPGEELKVDYEKNGPASREEFLDVLGRGRAHDIRRGTTTMGPHRDDIGLFVDGRDAKYFGSQGQQRTAALALKMAAFNIQREQRGFPPLLLLDDMLSDLDANRRTALAELVVTEAAQAVLTCTEIDSVEPAILKKAVVLKVSAGDIVS